MNNSKKKALKMKCYKRRSAYSQTIGISTSQRCDSPVKFSMLGPTWEDCRNG